MIGAYRTGKVLWQEWLGDPLMSQPALAKGKLYIAYPGGAPHGVQRGDRGVEAPAAGNAGNAAPPAAGKAAANAVGPAKGTGHRLLCADLNSGKHLWEQDITADVITAPVVEGEQVLLTCYDGTSFCLNANTGQVIWKKQHAGQSAPLMAEGKVIVTEKVTTRDSVAEGIKRVDVAKGEDIDQQPLALGEAKYLKPGASGNSGFSHAEGSTWDAGVGFSTAPPAAALGQAMNNSNVGTVAGGWAYQGSRVAYNNGRLMQGQANRLNCVMARDGALAWQAEASGKGVDGAAQIFCPPALGKSNMYVCTVRGEMLCVDQKDGTVGFAYALKQPMAFQPALAGGAMYAGTTNGLLICLKTGQKDADGWFGWGGNAQHNKKE